MGTDKRQRQKAARRDRMTAEAIAYEKQRRRQRIVSIIGAVAIVAVLIVAAVLFFGGDDSEDIATSPSTTISDVGATVASTTLDAPGVTPLEPLLEPGAELPADCPDGSEQKIDFDAPPPMCLYEGITYTAVFDTTEGEIRVELDTENTPVTANSFAVLSRWGYYDDTLIHRTEPSIDIIQGGSPHTNTASDPGPGYQLVDEGDFTYDTGQPIATYTYEPGQLVMARTGQPNGAGAQFFFVTGPNGSLLDSQGSYVVFGVTDAAGLEVAQSIIAFHDPALSAPSKDVTVNSITIEES